MSDPAARVSMERLVAHRDFVRRLARSLVHDTNGADDLEQEVWLTALRQPPPHEQGLRGWFRRVARSRVIDRTRGDARRTRLSESVCDSMAPSAAELATRLDTGRRVAAAVAGLEEPYRGTILLRFYDDVAPSEIAARTGVPIDTVRTRLRRAIERLREDLDRDEGGRDAWMASMLPLVDGLARHGTAGSTGSLIGGGAAMGAKVTIATAVTAAVIASLVTAKLARVEPRSDDAALASAADVSDLARRIEAVEARAPQTAQPRADGRSRAQDERITALEATVADLQKRAVTPASTAATAPDRPIEAKSPDDGTAESLRRIVTDTSEVEATRLAAFARLRGMPSGFTLEVILAARDIYRATTSIESRDAILRDLHNVKDEALLPEVRALFVAGLRDSEEKVRERAARDADAFASDPSVRQALEVVRDGDASEAIRERAAKSLEPRTRK